MLHPGIVRGSEGYEGKERIFFFFTAFQEVDGSICKHFGRKLFSYKGFLTVVSARIIVMQMGRYMPVCLIGMHSSEENIFAGAE